jgi:alpha-tubulin suppressor-like RCC1 family protein
MAWPAYRRHRLMAVVAMVVLFGGILPSSAVPAVAADKKLAGERHVSATSVSTTTVLGVGTGDFHTCAIRLADGSIGCWGEFGETVVAPAGTGFKAIDGYGAQTCAIGADDTITCWGYSYGGEYSEGYAPLEDPPAGHFRAVTTGGSHACAIRLDGTIACWGTNDYHQADAPTGTFDAVDAGWEHTCAIRSDDGSLVCWGNNEAGRATPPAGSFTSVTSGDRHSCGVRENGTVACWGFNGQNRGTPPTGTFTSVSAGGLHTCAISTSGEALCWGDNSTGQAGRRIGPYKAVSAGYLHTCAIATNDTLACWGENESGQVTPRPRATIAALPPWSTTTALDIRWAAAPALAPITTYDLFYRSASSNAAFGASAWWQYGTTDTTGVFNASPGYGYCFQVQAHDADTGASDWSDEVCTVTPLDDRSLTRAGAWTLESQADAYRGTVTRSTTAGATLTRTSLAARWIALLATTCPTCGTVQLFLGSSTTPFRTVSLYSPVEVKSAFIPVLDRAGWDDNDDPLPLATGTLQIKVSTSGKPVIIDGLLATRADLAPEWADGDDPPVPAAFSSGVGVRDVSTGRDSTCAITNDGVLACWGSNASGKALPPDGIFTDVAVGGDHACAIGEGGAITCWGDNSNGQLNAPEGSFIAVSASAWDTCAIDQAGEIACWGAAYDWGDVSPPQGEYTALAAANAWDYCALTSTGELDCWGESYDWGDVRAPSGTFIAIDGQCAIRSDGTPTCWGGTSLARTSPPDGEFTSVAASDLHACAIATDGTIHCWGDSAYYETAAPAGAFLQVDTGAHHSCAVGVDGALACWGHNRSGQVVARPTATLQALPTYSSTDRVGLAWSGKGLSPVATYDVRYRRAAWNGSFGSFTTWRSATTSMGATFSASPGYTYCYSVLARDTLGAVSSWTAERCTAVPLDDRSLTRSGSWTAGTSSSYYRSTYLRSSSYGASLTRTGVKAKSIALLVTTCSTCGKVNVYWGSTLLKTVNLYSSTTVTRKLIGVKVFSSATTGTLKIKVVTSGKKVYIDGVAIRRN